MRRQPLATSVIAGLLVLARISGAAEPDDSKKTAPTPATPPKAAVPPAKEKGASQPVKEKAPPTTPAAPLEASPEAKPEGAKPEGAGKDAAAPEAPADSRGTPALPEQGAAPTDEGRPGPVGIFPMQPQGPSLRPTAPTKAPEVEAAAGSDVLAEDWWSHARPAFEIHGYFRTRAELFQNFSLGRVDGALWPRPIDDAYPDMAGQAHGPRVLCTPNETGRGTQDDPKTVPLEDCKNKTQSSANLRFRLDPELHVSDNLRVISQIDILDNVVMGSTPSGYSFQPTATGGYGVNPRSGYTSNGVLDDTIVPPTPGVNSLQDSIRVKRAWAEYTTPVGELRFGRMPDHFGLGMVHHSGDGYDDDYQSTIDRLQFISAIKPLDLYLGASWDFPNEGIIAPARTPGGQAYDAGQLDDVNQWSLLVMRKQSPELTKSVLSKSGLVLNAGAYVTLRKQLLANDQPGTGTGSGTTTNSNVPSATLDQLSSGFARRNATIWVPDAWVQLLYQKFRFELEAAIVYGSMDNAGNTTPATPALMVNAEQKLWQAGFAAELEQKLVEDRLRLRLNVGWASGDADAYNSGGNTNNLVPQLGGQVQANRDKTVSTFRFNPSYRIDLILHRNLLGRVQGTYYFKPSVEYDFMRKPSGQRLGGGAGAIWTRASEFVQTPGHARDLGIELDGRLYFQSKDGSLNDRVGRMGGFYAMLEYGVLFPMSGLDYLPGQRSQVGSADTSAAHILRLYMGVLF